MFKMKEQHKTPEEELSLVMDNLPKKRVQGNDHRDVRRGMQQKQF